MGQQPDVPPEATNPAATPLPHDIPRTWWAWLTIALCVALAAAVLSMRFVSGWMGTQLDLATTTVTPSPIGMVPSLLWTLEIGVGLLVGTTVASWVFWTPRAAQVAGLGRGLACVVLLSGLIENGLVILARTDSSSTWSPVAAATVATVKWCAVVPATAIAVVGVLVASHRLIAYALSQRPSHSDERQQWEAVSDQLQLVAPLKLPAPRGARHRRLSWAFESWPPAGEKTLASGSYAAATNETPGAETRWQRAYAVPELKPPRTPGDRVGFALSGGGVRSASLAMGALDSLRPELVAADHLVSISGGGYTSGAFAHLLNTAEPDPAIDPIPVRDAETAYRAGSVELDHLRRHASYLASTAPQMLVALGVLARGMVATLTVIYGPAVLLGIGAAWFYSLIPVVRLPILPVTDAGLGTSGVVPPSAWLAAGLIVGLGGLVWLVQLLLVGLPGASVATWAWTRATAVFLTRMGLAVAALVVGLPGLAQVAWWVSHLVGHSGAVAVGASAGSVLVTYAASVASIAWRRRNTVSQAFAALSQPGAQRKIAVPAGLLQLLLVILSVGVVAASWLFILGIATTATATDLHYGRTPSGWAVLAFACGVAAVLLLAFSDETSLSLHPFYRRRLASAFATRTAVVKQPTGDTVVAIPYDPVERTRLSTHARAGQPGDFPELIFAAAANLTGEDLTPPGQTATSFTMSADWIGGPNVGWVRTAWLEDVSPTRLQRDLTVQGAVAISGAAFATAMGRFARWYQILLALTGARLGAWLPNPGFVDTMRHARRSDGSPGDWTVPGLPSMRRVSYLMRELLDIHPIEDRLLQVTDGGHYENLGLVELLRRRCTTIYCVDGGGDAPPTAAGLAQAIALAESELGVIIRLDDPLAAEPGSGTLADGTPSLSALQSVLVTSPVITGTITYPEASGLAEGENTGVLVVGRALLWPQLPYWLLSYAAQSPVFPHDSTGDQWFTNDQFTAYTALGREVGDEMRQGMGEAKRRAASSQAATPGHNGQGPADLLDANTFGAGAHQAMSSGHSSSR